MLKVRDLTRTFDSLVAVDHVNFEIGKGEIVGLLGHNGAGKTTVMKLVTGYLEPTSGEIEVDAISVAEDSVAAQRVIGYLPESSPLYVEQTVVEYLLFTAKMRGLVEEEAQEAIRNAIDATDLRDRALERIGTLSRGYQQRVGVAQALLHSPKLLILDEPTNGLDPQQTQHMRDLILSLSETATVILSTHIMQEVEAICDRVLILQHGKLAVDQNLSDISDSGRLELKTPATVEEVSTALGSDFEVSAGSDGVFIQARVDQPTQATSAVVKTLVAREIQVEGIAPEHKDLESLMREVGEVARAA